jgi:hypothetical protein
MHASRLWLTEKKFRNTLKKLNKVYSYAPILILVWTGLLVEAQLTLFLTSSGVDPGFVNGWDVLS